MKLLVRCALGLLLFGVIPSRVQAAFTSLYIFGDGVTTTTNNGFPTGYYGNRFTNGRVWAEVLAERQGLTYYPTSNCSYFGNHSATLVNGTLLKHVTNFVNASFPDISTKLVVVWVNSADLYYDTTSYATNIANWTNAINFAMTNHAIAIQLLYNKGVRTLVMPNAVDVTRVPEFATHDSGWRTFIRARCIAYNVAFSNVVDQARAAHPDINIFIPDFFTLLDNIMAQPAVYGVTNALYNGTSIGAVDDPALSNKSLTGPGAIYVYWDALDPTAMVHAWMAYVTQQLLSQPDVSGIAHFVGSNRVDAVNLPVGQACLIEGTTNLVTWTTNLTFTPTSLSQSVYVPDTEPTREYRLRYPFGWTWP